MFLPLYQICQDDVYLGENEWRPLFYFIFTVHCFVSNLALQLCNPVSLQHFGVTFVAGKSILQLLVGHSPSMKLLFESSGCYNLKGAKEREFSPSFLST